MAQSSFLSSLRSRLHSSTPASPHPRLQPSRGYHVELGAREKAVLGAICSGPAELSVLKLLEEDVALKRFKSYKNSVKRVSKIGNVLTLAVAVACTYEIAVLATSSK